MQPLYFAGAIQNLSDSPFIHVFLVLIVTDLLTGLAKAIKLKLANSSIGLNGLIRHAIIIFIVFMLTIYMPIFSLGVYVNWFIGYFAFQYLISIIENLGEIGVPLPKQLKETIYKLNDKLEVDIFDKLVKIERVDVKEVNKKESD